MNKKVKREEAAESVLRREPMKDQDDGPRGVSLPGLARTERGTRRSRPARRRASSVNSEEDRPGEIAIASAQQMKNADRERDFAIGYSPKLGGQRKYKGDHTHLEETSTTMLPDPSPSLSKRDSKLIVSQ